MSRSVHVQTVNGVPEPVAGVADLMSTFSGRWALCGGWAVDAWIGRQTRNHDDIDIAVFQGDERALFEHLPGWQLVAHDAKLADDSGKPWDGGPLVLPAHIHTRPPGSGRRLPRRVNAAAKQGFGVEFQFEERAGDEWPVSREPDITLPLSRCVRPSSWGLPTLVPEVLLFYKARDLRRRDGIDFQALLPVLGDEQRRWLRDAIERLGHPWLSQLSP